MSLGARDQQVLASIEASLNRSDPELAAQFDRFNCSPPRRAGPGRTKRWWRANRKVIALAALGLAIAAAVLASLPSSGQAGSRCGTATASCPQTEYGCYGVSGTHRRPGATPVCQTQPPNTP